MKKIIIVVLLVVAFAVPVVAEWSENVSQSEGWEMKYEKGWDGQPVKLGYFNVSGYTAFNITWVVNFYDSFGKYLGRKQGQLPGPIHQYFYPKVMPPKNCSTMTGEVYCNWQ